MASLKEICKKRILEEMVRPTHGAQGYVAMIVDDKTLKVLNSCCKVSDVLEEGVTVVEKIEKKRQPLPELDGLYFISPDTSSVDDLILDFANENKPQHKHIHIYFSSPLGANSPVMDKIAANSKLVPRISTFAEFSLNFSVYESRVFHFDSPESLTSLFPLCSGGDFLGQVSDKVLCLLASLGEKYPTIRYMSSPFPVCEQVAHDVHSRLTTFTKGLKAKQGKCTVMILDRSVDVATILLHEYTYQAMAFDVLEIPVCETKKRRNSQSGEQSELRQDDTFEYEFTNNLQQKEKKIAMLGEHDPLWLRFRHNHVSSVNDTVIQEIRDFARSDTAKITKGERLTTAETAQAIRQMPQYQETLARYWAHCALSERCFAQLDTAQLMKVGEVEQDLACGVDRNGDLLQPFRTLMAMSTLFTDQRVTSASRVRLIALYCFMMDGIKQDDLNKIMDKAGLTPENRSVLMKLLKLGLHEADPAKQIQPGSSKSHSHRLPSSRTNIFKKRAKEVTFELSRFLPVLRDIAIGICRNTLPKDKFPYVDETQEKANVPSTSKANAKPNQNMWDWDSNAATNTVVKGERDRVVIVILGGVTFAEIRTAYEVSESENADVFVGGTSILTPRHVLEACAASPHH
eukprot:GHVR01004972.1.p1 GENE.GHVR01004972.1~~GHVR01004972.1.p1  ORF type:complete len:637 (+),score=125.47 GHVR01004972.1:23-1912(+)